MLNKKIVSTIFTIIMASSLSYGASMPAYMKEQISYIQSAVPNGAELQAIDVPVPNNFLSEWVEIGVLSMGTLSNAADTILLALSAKKGQHIAIVGESYNINIATLKSVIGKGKDVQLSGTIYVVSKEKEGLQKLVEDARQVGITVVVVSPR